MIRGALSMPIFTTTRPVAAEVIARFVLSICKEKLFKEELARTSGKPGSAS